MLYVLLKGPVSVMTNEIQVPRVRAGTDGKDLVSKPEEEQKDDLPITYGHLDVGFLFCSSSCFFKPSSSTGAGLSSHRDELANELRVRGPDAQGASVGTRGHANARRRRPFQWQYLYWLFRGWTKGRNGNVRRLLEEEDVF